jgi:hypothetical protein
MFVFERTAELQRILSSVELRFGARVPGWTMLPVLIEGQRFPQTLVSEASRTFRVRLTESTNDHPQQALFQLAHEAIHCLSPAERCDTIWFEEGLANHHSLTFSELPARYRKESEERVPSLFVEPLAAFRSLNPADEMIKALRLTYPDFNSWNADLIQQHFATTRELAERLAGRLPKERPETM